MNEATEFLRKLFSTSDFPPRWHCGHMRKITTFTSVLSRAMQSGNQEQ